MANAFITQQIGPVCNQALGILHWSVILPRLLYRDCAVDGNIATGDTVNIRKPASFTAKKFVRATGLEVQDVVESSVPVKLADIWDVSVSLTDEQVTMDLTSFGEQVTRPAMIALANEAEALAVATLKGTTTPVHDVIKATPVQSVIDAVAKLNQNQVAPTGRNLVVGTSLAALLKSSDNLLRVDASGTNDTLRNAQIGRLAGADVYENPHVAADEGYLFGTDAAVFVTRALSQMGTSQAATGTFEGVAMRTIIDHDINKKQMVASFDFLTGSARLDDKRIVPLKIKV
jgi:hypothetical protein